MGFPTITQLVRLGAVRDQMETELHLEGWFGGSEGCNSSRRDFPAHHCSGGTAASIHISVAHYVDLIKLIKAKHAQKEKGSQRPETDNLVRRRLHAEILLSTSTPTFLSHLFMHCSLTTAELLVTPVSTSSNYIK